MNVFLFTTQTKLALMQTQITNITNAIQKMQERMDSLIKEMEHIKNSPFAETPSINDEYFNEALEPMTPAHAKIVESQFVLIPSNVVNNDSISDSESESEYDSEY